MKTIIITLFTFLSFQKALSQFNFYYKDQDSTLQNIDSNIRNFLPKLDDSYFVLTFPILDGVTSTGMQAYKAFQSVRATNKTILIVIDNRGGIRTKDIPLLFDKILKPKEAEKSKILFFVNTKLYKTILGNNELVRLLYVFRGHIFYDENQKYHKADIAKLPFPKIRISEEKDAKLTNLDSAILKKGDALFSYTNNEILILGDINNVLYKINSLNGSVTPFLDLKKYFQPYDVYNSEIINFDTAKYNLAKRKKGSWVKRNRQTLQLANIRYQNNEIVGVFSIEVAEKNAKTISYINDEAKQGKWHKDSLVLSNYLFFFHWSPETREITKLSKLDNPKKDFIYSNADCGFYFDAKNLFTANLEYPVKHTSKKRIALYNVANNGNIQFSKLIPPLTLENDLLEYNNYKDFFYKFNGRLLYNYTCLPDICVVGETQKVSTLFGDGSKPYDKIQFKSHSETDKNTKINFEIHNVTPILNGKYLLAFYKYKSNYVFEIKDTALNTIDIIEAKNIKGFDGYINENAMTNLLITDNKIYYLDIINDELFLKSFTIIEENNEAIYN